MPTSEKLFSRNNLQWQFHYPVKVVPGTITIIWLSIITFGRSEEIIDRELDLSMQFWEKKCAQILVSWCTKGFIIM